MRWAIRRHHHAAAVEALLDDVVIPKIAPRHERLVGVGKNETGSQTHVERAAAARRADEGARRLEAALEGLRGPLHVAEYEPSGFAAGAADDDLLLVDRPLGGAARLVARRDRVLVDFREIRRRRPAAKADRQGGGGVKAACRDDGVQRKPQHCSAAVSGYGEALSQVQVHYTHCVRQDSFLGVVWQRCCNPGVNQAAIGPQRPRDRLQ